MLTIKSELTVNLAGIIIKLQFYPTKNVLMKNYLEGEIEKVWGKFEVNSRKPDFVIRIKDGVNEIYRNKDKYYYLTFVKKLKAKSVNTTYQISIGYLDFMFREIVNNKLEKDGFILHASAVMGKDKIVRIFLAKSGGGKSTTANTFEKCGYKIIADDSIVVRKELERWVVYAPPFLEKTHQPIKIRLNKLRIYIIEKSDKPGLKQVTVHKISTRNIINSLWLTYRNISEAKLKNVMKFANEVKLYKIKATLNHKEMGRLTI
jgi:hypothetical protein